MSRFNRQVKLPGKFKELRVQQARALECMAETEKRFRVVGLPTGSGKSLFYVMRALQTGKRAAVLTGTKGLQDQLEKDFGEVLADVRGRENYPCVEHTGESCLFGVYRGCKYRQPDVGGCPQVAALRTAQGCEIVSTNYSYWLHAKGETSLCKTAKGRAGMDGMGGMEGRAGEVRNPFELLIMDEGHLADQELARFLQVKITKTWLKRVFAEAVESEVLDWPGVEAGLEAWQEWAVKWGEVLAGEIAAKKVRAAAGDDAATDWLPEGERMGAALDALVGMEEEGWIVDGDGKTVVFDPVWPGLYGKLLFANIPEVIITSATISPKTLALIGIRRDQAWIKQFPSTFPKHRMPVYTIDGAPRLNWRSGAGEYGKWVEMIDAIIAGRRDRSGVIHVGSYDRQAMLAERSKHSSMFITHRPGDRDKAVAEFIKAGRKGKPKILVSPSVTTGFDFPGRVCEYQIVGKLPYPDTSSKVMKARAQKDSEYVPYLTMMAMVQALGRGMRSKEDRCEGFIVDGNIGWFMQRYRHLGPAGFDVRRLSGVPKAPPRVEEEVGGEVGDE